MNIKQIENKIRRAIKRAQKNGIKIISGDYGVKFHQIWMYDFTKYKIILEKYDDGKCLCPIGACLIGKEVKILTDTERAYPESYIVSKMFGKSPEWVWAFVNGFDGCDHLQNTSTKIKSAFNLGKKLRKEFITNKNN